MKKSKPILILVCLYLFHVLSNYIWLKLDTTYQLLDSAEYHLSSLAIFEALKNSLPTFFSQDIFRFFDRSGFFVNLISAPFYFILGISQDVATMISGDIFLAVLLFSLYGIGKKLKDEKTGLLAAFMVSMYPTVFNQLRVYMFDLPLCACVGLNIYLLICSDYFRNKFFTVLYALSLAIGMLVKFNFLAFIIGPMVLVLYKNQPLEFKKGINLEKKFLLALLITAAAIIWIFGRHSFRLALYHSYDISWLKNIIYFSKGDYGFRFISLINLIFKNLLLFLSAFVNGSVTLFFSATFIIGLIVVLRLKYKFTFFLLLPILIPLFFVICIFDTSRFTARYMLASCVFIALISAIGVMNIKLTYLRRLIIMLILTVGFIQYFAFSYGFGTLGARIFSQDCFFHPQKDYASRRIVSRIIQNCHLKKGDSFIFLDYRNDIQDILYPLRYEAFKKTKEQNTIKDPFYLEYNNPPNQYRPIRQEILQADYIATLEGIPEGSDLIYLPELKEEIRKTKEYFYHHRSAFKLVCTIDLPDRRALSVYMNILKSNNVESGPFKILLKQGFVHFFYLEKRITEDEGLNTHFTYKQKRYFSSDAIWQMRQPEANRIFIRLSWPGLDIRQIWELRIQEERINWEIYLDNPKKLLLYDFRAEFHLPPGYRNWQDSSKSGSFPSERLPWLKSSPEIRVGVFSSSALFTEGSNVSQNGLPGVSFRTLNENYLKDIGLDTDSFTQAKTCIFYINLLTAHPELAENKPLLFSGEFSLFTDPLKIKQILRPSLKIKQILRPPQHNFPGSLLELFFSPSEGKIKFLYKGKLITEDKGLCAYFRYNQRYYSLYEASCQLEKSEPKNLVLRFSWPSLDVSQVWELSLENGRINWQIYLYNPRQLLLEDMRLEFRLVSDYRLWQDYFNSGSFPEILPGKKESRRINRKVFLGSKLVINPVNFRNGNMPGLLQCQQDNFLKSIDLYTIFENHKKFRIIEFKLLDLTPKLSEDKLLIFSGDFYLFTNFLEIPTRNNE